MEAQLSGLAFTFLSKKYKIIEIDNNLASSAVVSDVTAGSDRSHKCREHDTSATSEVTPVASSFSAHARYYFRAHIELDESLFLGRRWSSPDRSTLLS